MKKMTGLFMIVCFMFIATFAMAAGPVSVPTTDGNDVLVPDAFIQTIPGATADNVWCRFHDRSQPWVKMTKEGENWRIPGGRGQDIHPFIGDYAEDYSKKKFTNFAKIEDMGWDDEPFVNHRGGRICLNVK